MPCALHHWGLGFMKQKEMGRRILNEALRAMVNAEQRGKASVELKPVSTVMSSFLKIMKDRGKAIALFLWLPIWVLFIFFIWFYFADSLVFWRQFFFWGKIQPGLCLKSWYVINSLLWQNGWVLVLNRKKKKLIKIVLLTINATSESFFSSSEVEWESQHILSLL